jgi:hypothetical protein
VVDDLQRASEIPLLQEGLLDLEKTLNSKFKFKIHELLFMVLFKFSGYYSNAYHYLKCSLLFKFGIG